MKKRSVSLGIFCQRVNSDLSSASKASGEQPVKMIPFSPRRAQLSQLTNMQGTLDRGERVLAIRLLTSR